MVPVQKLIELFQQMYREHWKYSWSGHEKGNVGCAGAFKYAFSLFGISYPNGSNSIARKRIVGDLLPISEAKPGMAAVKVRPWKANQKGNAWYNKPPGDIYHIGLVDDDPAYVLNAKGTDYGFCRDKISAGWDYVFYLKDVDYGKEGKTGVDMTVVLPSGAKGNTVNLREKMDKNSDVVTRVPVGSVVTLLDDFGAWCFVRYENKTGYMMSNYLEYDGQDGESITQEQYDQINNALEIIQEQTELIGKIIGRG